MIVVGLFVLSCVGYMVYLYNDMYSEEHIPPMISFDEDLIEVSVYDGDDVLLEGVYAYDKQDGDVSDSLIVEEKTRFTSDNTRSVSYVAFDSDNNACRSSRWIVYTDYELPDILLISPLIFSSDSSGFTPEECVKASSVLDGDLTSKVRILNSEDYKEGDNTIELAVSDSAGGERRIAVTCTINSAVNTNLLEIVLSDYLIKANVGDVINPYDYISDVLVREDSLNSLKSYVSYNDVSLNKEGVYEINYSLTYGENEAYSRLVILVEGGTNDE